MCVFVLGRSLSGVGDSLLLISQEFPHCCWWCLENLVSVPVGCFLSFFFSVCVCVHVCVCVFVGVCVWGGGGGVCLHDHICVCLCIHTSVFVNVSRWIHKRTLFIWCVCGDGKQLSLLSSTASTHYICYTQVDRTL